jgi:hypothetical protein
MKILTKLCFVILVVTSCKKENHNKSNALANTYPIALNTIITPAIIATLQSHGTVIYNGLTPPVINGIYLLSPAYCTFDNSGENAAGVTFDDYKLQFSNENTSAFTISLDFKDVGTGTDTGSDATATYISGTGNSFTVFSQSTGITTGVSNVRLNIISGILESGYIKNFQWSTYLVSKGADPNSVLEPLGSTMIFNDEDGVSETLSTFSLPGTKIQTVGGEQRGSVLATIHK